MKLIDVVESNFRKYFDISGRTTLNELWTWVLFVVVVDMVLFYFSPLLCSLFLLAVLLHTAAASTRRLHDTNRSGWWTLPALLPVHDLPFLAAICVFENTVGPNRFGPDPLGREPRGSYELMPADDAKPAYARMHHWQHGRSFGATAQASQVKKSSA